MNKHIIIVFILLFFTVFCFAQNSEELYLGLESLNNKLCIYLPCDNFNQKNILFNNNEVILKIGEEEIYTITDTKNNKNSVTYTIENEFQKGKLSKKEINHETLFYIELPNSSFYLLTTSDTTTEKYPIVKNDCEAKLEELTFDEIDYSKLWNLNQN